MRYKCYNCFIIFNDSDVCPQCNDRSFVEEMCEKDHCKCSHEVMETIAYCEECGRAMCPICRCHDVMQISRVTGYLQDVAGWNAAKRQELKDRTRYEVT